eukprot:g10878.t1
MAAARAQARRRKKERLEQRQQAYKLKQAEDKKLIEELLHKYDENNSGGFDKSQLRNVLIHIDPDREPDDESIEFIMHRLEDENGEVQANKISIVILKYRKYLKQKDRYDSLFKKFDINDSGKLDKAQLLAMLKEVARGRVSVDEDDVNRVMEAADQDKSGDIDADEMKVAVAEWDQTIQAKIQKRQSSMCNVL